MLLIEDDGGGLPPLLEWKLLILVSFYEHIQSVARLSMCEITSCPYVPQVPGNLKNLLPVWSRFEANWSGSTLFVKAGQNQVFCSAFCSFNLESNPIRCSSQNIRHRSGSNGPIPCAATLRSAILVIQESNAFGAGGAAGQFSHFGAQFINITAGS